MNTGELWKSFRSELLGYVKSKVNNVVLAEDLVQDVFLKIHLKSDELSEKENIKSWLYTITKNTIIDFYRKKKIPQNELNDIFAADEKEEEEEILRFTKCLLPFIQKLPEQDKDAILKTDLGNLSQKEYAEQVNLSYTAIKSRVQRARKKLNTSFQNCCKLQFDENGKLLPDSMENCKC